MDASGDVPYQAYRPKRNSRNFSNPSTPLAQPTSPSSPFVHSKESSHDEKIIPLELSLNSPTIAIHAPSSPPSEEIIPTINDSINSNNTLSTEPPAVAGPSEPTPEPIPVPPLPRKTSTFRRMPLRNARPTLPPSPLRSAESQHTLSSPPAEQQPTSASTVTTNNGSFTPPPRSSSLLPTQPSTPVAIITSPKPITSPTPIPSSKSVTSPSPSKPSSPSPQPIQVQMSAPPPPRTMYRPGFQPPGVRRPLTDIFLSIRREKRDIGRIERTKLERRLEKLTALHFPDPSAKTPGVGPRPSLKPATASRRASSFFEDFNFKELRNSISSVDGAGLWRGVMMQSTESNKNDIRAAEQRITPWQEDAKVSKCPLCTASFHPLTNRKHHCRTCGRIVCSLPPKRPLRPEPCSFLFIVDPKTRKIEQVGEGVDYGVRKRRGGSGSVDLKTASEEMDEAEKFLKGVRICRDCKPVLARQQHQYDAQHVPTFVKLYETFVVLEKEIEDSLPQFQELLLTLTNDNQPTKEASLARKRLLDAFSQYDALSKKIRFLPCEKGSSMERVQSAVLSRASAFLQKNMFPLQSLPKPKSRADSNDVPANTITLSSLTSAPPDTDLAHTLQPLLEQEAMLESFVQEATASRKFEDAKTLKINLGEIRSEIERVVREDGGGNVSGNGGNTSGSASGNGVSGRRGKAKRRSVF